MTTEEHIAAMEMLRKIINDTEHNVKEAIRTIDMLKDIVSKAPVEDSLINECCTACGDATNTLSDALNNSKEICERIDVENKMDRVDLFNWYYSINHPIKWRY